MIIKQMADEEKKRPFHASGRKKLGIEEKATAGGIPIRKKRRRLPTKEPSKDNNEIVETFLQSLTDGPASKGHITRAGSKKPADDANQLKLSGIHNAKKAKMNAKPTRNTKGNETASLRPQDQDRVIDDPTRRYSPPVRLNLTDQDQPRGVNPLNAPGSDLRTPPIFRSSFDSRLAAEQKSSLEAGAGSSATGASDSGFRRQTALPGLFPSDRAAHQQLHASSLGVGYYQNIDAPLHASLARQTLGFSDHVPSGTSPTTSSLNFRLNEFRRLHAQQTGRLPSNERPNSIRLALSSLYSRQHQMHLTLGTSNTNPVLPASLNQMMPPLQHLGFSGLNLFAPGLGQFIGRGNEAAAATRPSNPNPRIPPFNRLLDLSSRSVQASPHGVWGTTGFLPPRGDQEESLPVIVASPGAADAGAKSQKGSGFTSATAGGKHNQQKTRALPVYVECDELCLSKFQCLARKQIEVFEASEENVQTGARGRNNPIVLGQVGIRCHHCSRLPHQARTRGAIYYPTKFDRVYQTAVNMASIHLCNHCACIPEDIRQELLSLKDQKSIVGGGKEYWASGIRMLGIVETVEGLKFADSGGHTPL
jgi:hypothetical protein